MSETQKVPTWYWVVTGLALLWNLMGVMAFFAQVLTPPEVIAAMPEAERMLIEAMPGWALLAFAVAVFCGVLGCVALAMRKNWAVMLFQLSLAGVIIQNVNAFFIQDSFAVFGPGGTIMAALVAIIAIALWQFALSTRNKGWIT